MSGKRIVEETPCEHGNVGQCWHRVGEDCGLHGKCGDPSHYCPGGSKRSLTEGQYVLIEKVDGEWPLPISINRLYWEDGAPVDVDEMLDYFADALSDHTEGTP